MERPRLAPPKEILNNILDIHRNAIADLEAVAEIFTDPLSEFDEAGLMTSMRLVRSSHEAGQPMSELVQQFEEALLIWGDPELGIARADLLTNCYLNNKSLWNSHLDRLDSQIAPDP